MFLSLIPFYGVNVLYFTFDFLCIDKGDEFQLIQFIGRAKKFYFISYGVLKGCTNYLLYYVCVNFQNYSPMEHHCIDYGPGFFQNFWVEIASTWWIFLLTWIAFGLLQLAKPKGAPKFKYQHQQFHN